MTTSLSSSKRESGLKKSNADSMQSSNGGLMPQHHSSSNTDGNLTSYTHFTINMGANSNLTESANGDSSDNNSVTQYQTSTDADGNVALDGGTDSVAEISELETVTEADVVPSNDLTKLINPDENLGLQIKVGEIIPIDDMSVICDRGLQTQCLISTDADGNVTGYTHIITTTDFSGSIYTTTNQYDANWNLTKSAYSDSSGINSVTQYQTSTDADGNVAGYTHITTWADVNGNSYTSTNHYDPNLNLTESAYSDSSGNNIVTQYQTSADADGNVTSYTHITTNTDVNGNASTATNYYDASWNLTESAYSDSSGNNSVTQYQTTTDADGNVTGYTHITTNTDVNGNASTSTNHYDANWNLTESAYSDSLLVFELVEETIVPVICVCWREEDLYPVEDSLNNWITKDLVNYGDFNGTTTANFEIGLVGVTEITSSDFIS